MIPGYRYERKISVVPIINVSLVIVLTLMMIAPFLSDSDKQVNLPEARAADVDDTDNVEITFTLDQEVFIGDQQVSLQELPPCLAPLLTGAPDAVVVIKADKDLFYRDVEKLIAAVETAKAPRIALATRQKSEAAQ